MSVRPRGVKFPVLRINRKAWKYIIERSEERGVINQRGSPSLSHVRAARDIDVIEIRALRFLNPGFARRVNVIDVVRQGVCDNRPLIVIESRVAGCAALPHDWACNLLPCV